MDLLFEVCKILNIQIPNIPLSKIILGYDNFFHKIKSYKKNELIIEEGKEFRKMGLIIKGSVMAYGQNTEGELQFYMHLKPQNVIYPLEHYVNKENTMRYVALENTIIIMFKEEVQQSKYFSDMVDYVEEQTYSHWDDMCTMRSLTGLKEKYLFLEKMPHFSTNINLKYLAMILNCNQNSLSRLKTELLYDGKK